MLTSNTRFLSNFVKNYKQFKLQRYGFFMNYKLIFFIIIVSFFSCDVMAQANKIQTVVIDAGHGGKDPGAVGSKAKEKNVTLAVAKKTGEYIKKKYPDVKVVYTRSTDVFVELMERARIANRNNADLFISIHCNSVAKSPATAGVETYVMGEHRNSANLNVAKRENASILYESNAEADYGGFDPNSTEAYIAFSFIQSEYKQHSLELAELIQNELVDKAKRKDRGVQQAGFLVLYKTAMPSVLVELGFITNQQDEAFMMSADGQDYLASAIYRAFCTYKTNYEKESVELQHEAQPTVPAAVSDNGVVYKVQFTTKSRKLDNAQSVYKDLRDIEFYEHNGMYKYTAGRFATRAEADAYLREVIAKGYNDAFVVKFENGIRK